MQIAKTRSLWKVSPDEPQQPPKAKFLVHCQETIEIMLIRNVIAIQAEGNYSWIISTGDQRLLASKTLKFYENHLRKTGFIRIHQSWLINPEKLIRIIKGNPISAIMEDGLAIPVSRSRKPLFLAYLENHYPNEF